MEQRRIFNFVLNVIYNSAFLLLLFGFLLIGKLAFSNNEVSMINLVETKTFLEGITENTNNRTIIQYEPIYIEVPYDEILNISEIYLTNFKSMSYLTFVTNSTIFKVGSYYLIENFSNNSYVLVNKSGFLYEGILKKLPNGDLVLINDNGTTLVTPEQIMGRVLINENS